ncbi:MAG TPA: hypothetical protein VGH14_15575 [Solirubrobacterales bacterium]|jgi:hypothetical protein
MSAALTGTASAAVRLDPPLTVEATGGVDSPEAVIDEAGTTSIAWATYDGNLESTLKFRSVAADGQPGPVRVLAAGTKLGESGIGPVGGQIAVTPDGAATVVGVRWPHPANGGSEIVAVRIGADGMPEAPLTLFAGPEWYAEEPQVGVDPEGNATVVWRSHRLAEVRIEAVRIAADGTVGPIVTLATGGTHPRLAVGSEGSATAVWTTAGATGLDYVRIGATGTVGTTETLPGSGGQPGQTALAIDSQGRTTVVWRWGPEEAGEIDASLIAADGTAEESRTLTDEPVGLFADPAVAVDDRGAWVTWSRQEGAVEDFRWSVQLSWVDWSSPQEEAATVSGPEADHAQIGLPSSGHGWIAWSAHVEGKSVVQFRRLTEGDASLGRTQTLPGGPRNYAPTPVADPQGEVNLIWREVGSSAQAIAYAHGETVAPETSIDTAAWPFASFTFSSPDFLIEGFECNLDGAGFAPCYSPVDYGLPAPGPHTFEVRALDEDGSIDPTQAVSSFEIPDVRPHEPEAPHPGAAPPPIPLPSAARVEPIRSRTSIATAAGSASIKSGRALLRVRCPAEGSCEGTAVLVGVGRDRGTRLGQGRFDLKPSGAVLLAVPLTPAARRLLGDRDLTAARLQGVGIHARRIKLS